MLDGKHSGDTLGHIAKVLQGHQSVAAAPKSFPASGACLVCLVTCTLPQISHESWAPVRVNNVLNERWPKAGRREGVGPPLRHY